MEFNLDLKSQIIDNETLRWVEIYKITNIINKKVYIGQAISHIRKRNKLIPHGTSGRFNTHIQEALGNNNTKYSCRNLNNAIKKYGQDNFTLDFLKVFYQLSFPRLISKLIFPSNNSFDISNFKIADFDFYMKGNPISSNEEQITKNELYYIKHKF